MIDDKLWYGPLLHRLATLAKLAPDARVDDDDGLRPGEAVVAGPEALDALLGVHEVIAVRKPAADDDSRLLSELLEQVGHAELRAERIAIGPNVREQDEARGLANEFDEGRPI